MDNTIRSLLFYLLVFQATRVCVPCRCYKKEGFETTSFQVELQFWRMGVEPMSHNPHLIISAAVAEPSTRFHHRTALFFKFAAMAAVAMTALPLRSFLNNNNVRVPTVAKTSTTSSRDIVIAIPPPLLRNNHSAASGALPRTGATETEDEEEHPTSRDPPKKNHGLRFDWSNLTLTTTLGRAMQAHQSNCALPLGDLRMRNVAGLGSDLHLWTQALCNAMQHKVRVQTYLPWIYHDGTACRNHSQDTAMLCYFPDSELLCPDDRAALRNTTTNRTQLYVEKRMVLKQCAVIRKRYNASFPQVRTSGIEYLFSHTSSVVIQEAERQLKQVFGDEVPLPSQLITVHIRWGDKSIEMDLVPIQEYVDAVQSLASDKNLTGADVNIFLASEDPQAVKQFQNAARSHQWNVFVDAYFQDFGDVPHQGINGNSKLSKRLQGRPGLVALASVLVALQANSFVLTTRSNWSRLINELRKSVLDPRCDSCSRLIDLTKTLNQW